MEAGGGEKEDGGEDGDVDKGRGDQNLRSFCGIENVNIGIQVKILKIS